ncbi:hypothetical protein M8007_12220 [Dinoroseobacter shibae]|uniref:hypothetical protein n=1 Tax=Dinoroseobacter shibae TaxID=215813 RepID=UPI0000E92C9C|nr:hypothetical protein [Dinoroseobacter shibae]URF45543.1 hypothetical protein M8008_12220 [Dinoroseobacter shibae]URF49848.1 hypothetical protein M8007_12220 [Dinoroseobacter shibae]
MPTAPLQPPANLAWMHGVTGAFRNAYRFMCLFQRSDRELERRGLSRKQLVDSYLRSFDA